MCFGGESLHRKTTLSGSNITAHGVIFAKAAKRNREKHNILTYISFILKNLKTIKSEYLFKCTQRTFRSSPNLTGPITYCHCSHGYGYSNSDGTSEGWVMFKALNWQTKLQGHFLSNSWSCLDWQHHCSYLCVLEGTSVSVEVTASDSVWAPCCLYSR